MAKKKHIIFCNLFWKTSGKVWSFEFLSSLFVMLCLGLAPRCPTFLLSAHLSPLVLLKFYIFTMLTSHAAVTWSPAPVLGSIYGKWAHSSQQLTTALPESLVWYCLTSLCWHGLPCLLQCWVCSGQHFKSGSSTQTGRQGSCIFMLPDRHQPTSGTAQQVRVGMCGLSSGISK